MFLGDAFNHVATYWGTPVQDGYGKRSFANPATIACRWEDRNDLQVMYQGEMIASNAVIYSFSELVVGGYLAYGNQLAEDPEDTSAPQDLEQANIIKTVERQTSLTEDIVVYKAVL